MRSAAPSRLIQIGERVDGDDGIEGLSANSLRSRPEQGRSSTPAKPARSARRAASIIAGERSIPMIPATCPARAASSRPVPQPRSSRCWLARRRCPSSPDSPTSSAVACASSPSSPREYTATAWPAVQADRLVEQRRGRPPSPSPTCVAAASARSRMASSLRDRHVRGGRARRAADRRRGGAARCRTASRSRNRSSRRATAISADSAPFAQAATRPSAVLMPVIVRNSGRPRAFLPRIARKIQCFQM